jgi:hypothetical protein
MASKKRANSRRSAAQYRPIVMAVLVTVVTASTAGREG